MKPFFSGKGVQSNATTLIENKEIILDDIEVANNLNNFFVNSVVSLNLDIPCDFITD